MEIQNAVLVTMNFRCHTPICFVFPDLARISRGDGYFASQYKRLDLYRPSQVLAGDRTNTADDRLSGMSWTGSTNKLGPNCHRCNTSWTDKVREKQVKNNLRKRVRGRNELYKSRQATMTHTQENPA